MDDPTAENRGAICRIVDVKIPTLGPSFSFDIMAHNAHHYVPSVPMHRLSKQGPVARQFYVAGR